MRQAAAGLAGVAAPEPPEAAPTASTAPTAPTAHTATQMAAVVRSCFGQLLEALVASAGLVVHPVAKEVPQDLRLVNLLVRVPLAKHVRLAERV